MLDRCRLACLASLLVPLAGQDLPAPELRGGVGSAAAAKFAVQLPAKAPEQNWVPLLVLWPGGRGDAAAAQAAVRTLGADAARAGFVAVAPVCDGDALSDTAAALLFAELRRTFRVAQGGMHAAARNEFARATAFVLTHRHQFQSFTALAAASDAELAGLRRLTARRVHVLAGDDATARQQHFAALHAARELPGAANAVARALDDFHDAAANGDEARYFALLPDNAVFLGTDASERWTGAEFRAFAAPYFKRPEAWTYVPLQRHVTLSTDGASAWFDETLDNASYGICRGSGVLARRDEHWVLQQYNLTVPLPNDLAAAFAARIRRFTDGLPGGAARFLLVRHAEKVDQSKDAALSPAGATRAQALARALRDVPLDAVIHSEFQRTAATVTPLCAAKNLQPLALPAADVAALAARLRKWPAGQTVLVCGHSDTLPKLMQALGVPERKIADAEFDGLYLVTRGADGAQMLTLRYGE